MFLAVVPSAARGSYLRTVACPAALRGAMAGPFFGSLI